MSGTIGPALPPGYSATSRSPSPSSEKKKGQSTAENPDPQSAGSVTSFGPSLPPEDGVTPQMTNTPSFGPSLPPDMKPRPLGPMLPPGYSNVEDEECADDVIGPMPVVGGAKGNEKERIRREVESRSTLMKDKLLGKDSGASSDQPKREEWMTELPPEFKPLGVGPRKFRTTASDAGDRSVWTDTPADRVRKQQAGGGQPAVKEKEEDHILSAKEQEIAQQVDSYNKKRRSQSLMDMHRKRRAEELTKDGPTERRPFSRELDLEAPRNMVTPAKRRALVKDSRTALDKKFSRGTKSFL